MLLSVGKGWVISTTPITAYRGNYATKCQISDVSKRIQWICQEISVASIIGKCNEQSSFDTELFKSKIVIIF